MDSMEWLQGELPKKKINIFSDICHRMKKRPFSVQSSKGRGHEGIGSSFTTSTSSKPVQSKATNSKVKSAALHITSLELDTLSGSYVPKEKGSQAEESGSSRASSTSHHRKSARDPSAVKCDSANVPVFKQKEKTAVLPRMPTAHFPTSPPGKSNILAEQPLLEPRGSKPFRLSLHASGQGAACSELLGNFAAPAQDKEKGRAPPPHQDEDHELDINYRDNVRTNHALRPFPMDSQEMMTPHHRALQSSLQSTKSKRVLDHGDGECGRKTKRLKEDDPGNLTRLILGEEDHSDEDSFEIDAVFDPSTVCPYCDEPLPLNPTPQLKNLFATAKLQSYVDPRPRNPIGLKAPLGIYISACQRHHFETHSLPEALEKGWPQSIDFKKVPDRIENDDARGPRSRSVFWRELKKEIKKQGSRTATGLKGQFSTFEKTQPGYYGELGSLIIHQTLYNLFPLSSFDASSISPLSPAEFVQLVLVPEVAVGLIMQDLHLDRDEAIITLRESSQYGVGMFPDVGSDGAAAADDDDDDESIADRIVMERAKARRLELEEEEKIEEKMWTK
ncbi:RTC4-like domain-containing protein [Suillus placidus]|uniref:Restriction of telomere capping protein 4 n=1 Tax=Suillus placidus TaxID=48579 RepID=A0A9P6ZKG7_9AGAM|nr:RTC4-like domain-containing protein [Suillus placidus]